MSEPAKGSKVVRVLKALAPWVMSLGILAWVLLSQDLEAVAESLGRADYLSFFSGLTVFLAAGLTLDATYYFVSFRWLAGVGRFWEMFRARAATELLMVISLVAGLGGMLVYANRRYQAPLRRASAIMLNELLQEVGALGCLTILAALLVSPAQLEVDASEPLHAAKWFAIGTLGFYLFCVLLSRLYKILPQRLQFKSFLDLFMEISMVQYGSFLGLKITKNVAHAVFVVVGLWSFGIEVPFIVGLAFAQIVFMVRGLPVSAFGIGVDQLTYPALFGPWEPAGQPGQVLAFSMVYTFSLLLGRGLLGLPFVQRVVSEMRKKVKDPD